MIIIIQIQNIPFHYFEFVKPIEDIVEKTGLAFSSIHYRNLTNNHLENADKIIIAGTSLKDNMFLEDKERFSWIKTCQKPVLGICGGMQLLATTFDESLQKGQEIGLQTLTYEKNFLGESGQKEVYELHNNVVKPTIFDIIATSERYPQAIKHPESPLYGVLFHPEVRNKHIISYFIEKI